MRAVNEVTEFHVAGMTCQGCTRRVSNVLERLEGVHASEVTLGDETARVEYDASQVDTETMKQAIEKAGYEVDDQ